MKNYVLMVLTILALGTLTARADSSDDSRDHYGGKHFRLDCRFYDGDRDSCDKDHDCHKNCCNKPKHCVASATYKVKYYRADDYDRDHDHDRDIDHDHDRNHKYEIKDIHYGVRCDGDTIFSNQGRHFATTDPSNHTVEDHIRPLTSNVPETTLLNAGALVQPGTYEANLYLEQKKFKDGSCEITEQDDDHYLFLN